MSNFMDSYVDVAERIRIFKEQYPTGCLRPFNPAEPFKIMEIGGREFIVYTACAYRTPDDAMPAVAVAAEPCVGKTSFTKDSEVMNAETSAWGRAIVACLAADTQKIASANEVRNRQQENAKPVTNVTPISKAQPAVKQTGKASDAQIKYIHGLLKNIEGNEQVVCDLTGGTPIDKLEQAQAKQVINDLLAIKKNEAIFGFDENGTAFITYKAGEPL
jgi:hypothetical protein